jgi:uncharacterized NAD(P)/FAD-binding protein YdhS
MRLCIIGGGFCGASLALHLLRHNRAAAIRQIILCEPKEQLGLGVAYATPYKSHLLNVRHPQMGLYSAEPGHFTQWLRDTQHPTDGDFVPRNVFGKYMQANTAPLQHSPVVHHQRDIVVGLSPPPVAGGQARVHLAGGGTLAVDRVALCTGNRTRWPRGLPDLSGLSPAVRFDSAWAWPRLAALPNEGTVVALGCGLTMVDLLLALQENRFTGKLVAISRRGLAHLSHAPRAPDSPPSVPMADLDAAVSPAQLLRQLRKAALTHPWQHVVDALRPSTAAHWQLMAPVQRRQLLRHAKVYWDIHRHRLAPQVAQALAAARAQGRLELYAGRLLSVEPEGPSGIRLRIRRRSGTDLALQAHCLVNCSGADLNWRSADRPLEHALLAAGLALPDPYNLGPQTTADSSLRTAQGQASPWLSALGCNLMGRDFEAIAVPELRQQAEQLAHTWLKLTRC